MGQEINDNHFRAETEGEGEGEGRSLHLGRASNVWELRISNADGELVCISRVMMAVLKAPNRY